MFPIPKGLATIHVISEEPDRAYRALLAQEFKMLHKKSNHHTVVSRRTYKRVLLGKDIGLVVNSCDFQLLEKKYQEYSTSKLQ